MQAMLADSLAARGDLGKAEHFAALAAEATQRSGNFWALPQRLQETLASLKIAQGNYAEADAMFERAEAFIDSMIGKSSSVLDKTALIAASSEIYAKHFALAADHLKDAPKAFGIVEQVRGRILSDLLAGSVRPSPEAAKAERAISRLRLELVAARNATQLTQLRDKIFMAEQSRWVAQGLNIVNSTAHHAADITEVQRELRRSEVVLEYVLADPASSAS